MTTIRRVPGAAVPAMRPKLTWYGAGSTTTGGKAATGIPAKTLTCRNHRYEEIVIAGKEEKLEFEGEVIEAFRNGMYKIALDNGHETLGYTAGKMRRYRIKILPGDRINIELSPYDLSRGRIVYRHR